jgi:hypothetical protein
MNHFNKTDDGGSKIGSLTSLHPQDGGNEVLRNFIILLQHYTASQPRRLRPEVKFEFRVKDEFSVDKSQSYVGKV